jgi:hypothetical protein
LRDELRNQSDSSKKYYSFQQYYDDKFKHKRKETSPNETFKSPVTFGHGYGFYKFSERNLNDVGYPRKKCEETKYAENIILTGNKFMK